MSEGVKVRTFRGTKTATNYKAPTSGLEHSVFEYGERMKPGSFKSMIESIPVHMASTLKYGGPEASRAINRAENPAYVGPDESIASATRKQLMTFDQKFDQWMKKEKPGKRIQVRSLRNCRHTVLHP